MSITAAATAVDERKAWNQGWPPTVVRSPSPSGSNMDPDWATDMARRTAA